MIKKLFLLLIIISLYSCQSVKDALSGKKYESSDEFLVIKKNPLVEPEVVDTKKIRKVKIGKIPIMVGSKYCVLSSQKNRKKGQECLYDYGGYFVINGNEKVCVSQEKIAENNNILVILNL